MKKGCGLIYSVKGRSVLGCESNLVRTLAYNPEEMKVALSRWGWGGITGRTW
jgi:hypothetical protein